MRVWGSGIPLIPDQRAVCCHVVSRIMKVLMVIIRQPVDMIAWPNETALWREWSSTIPFDARFIWTCVWRVLVLSWGILLLQNVNYYLSCRRRDSGAILIPFSCRGIVASRAIDFAIRPTGYRCYTAWYGGKLFSRGLFGIGCRNRSCKNQSINYFPCREIRRNLSSANSPTGAYCA
jgi:hypothetical protein